MAPTKLDSSIYIRCENITLSNYIKNIEELLLNLTNTEPIDDKDVDSLNTFIDKFRNVMIEYSKLRNQFGRPDLDSSILLFNLSEAKTPFGKCVRCIAEIEDRIKAIKENISSIKTKTFVKDEKELDSVSRKYDLTYFKSAINKLLFLIKTLKSIKEKYNLPDEWTYEYVNESMKKEKLFKIIDEIVFSIINVDQIRYNNNTLILYNLGVNIVKLREYITQKLNDNYNHILDGFDNRYKFLEDIYKNCVEPYINKYEELLK